MIIRLGYVAISKAIEITSSGTITYTNYLKEENKDEKLDKIIKSNLRTMHEGSIYRVIFTVEGIDSNGEDGAGRGGDYRRY